MYVLYFMFFKFQIYFFIPCCECEVELLVLKPGALGLVEDLPYFSFVYAQWN